MSRESEFLDKLKETFKGEAEEHRTAILSGLLALEKEDRGSERDAGLVENIFREVHSLKGAARAVDMRSIERLCQSIEGIFSGMKQGYRRPDKALFDALYRALDMVAALEKGTALASEEDLEDILKLLKTKSGAGEVPKAPPRPGPDVGPARPALVSLSDTVRVPGERLRSIFLHAEELLSVKQAMARHAADLHVCQEEGAAAGPFKKKLESMASDAALESLRAGEHLDSLLAEIRTALMMPFTSLLELFPRMVRDLAAEEGKEVSWEVRGEEDIQIDRRVLEEIKDPLIHLVRNSVSHGIETPDERKKRGKPGTGSVSLHVARVENDKVELTLRDDGAGVDLAGVKEVAVARGLLTEARAAALEDKDSLQLIFFSELSTSPMITDISGRGLGLAIAHEKVEALRGQLSVETARGQGTTFRVILPLSLATFRGVIVKSRGQTFVIPTVNVDKVLRVDHSTVVSLEDRPTIPINGMPVPLVELGDLLGLKRVEEEETNGRGRPAVVLVVSGTRVAFAIDELLGEQEVLVKNLGRQLVRVRNTSGATLLADGELVLILNPADLLKSASLAPSGPPAGDTTEARGAVKGKILLAEDSVTSRMLLQSILESAGFQVTTTVDGAEAFATLRVEEFDLLVSDVDMPRMNGFDLCRKVRGFARTEDLPIVLVTTLDSREDRERGIDAGANAYIAKASFDQSNLLEVVKRLL
jgi:two-component system, chemotaxis family, sensor kinase CheA